MTPLPSPPAYSPQGSARHRCRRCVQSYALIALLLLTFHANPARAQLPQEEEFDTDTPFEDASPMLERETGFLVDRTITNFGATFVREFAHAWRARRIEEPVDLTIIEKPSARWGSLIIIEHRNQPVARLFLYAGRSATITPLAVESVNYLARRVVDNALLDKLFKNPDLAPDELP